MTSPTASSLIECSECGSTVRDPRPSGDTVELWWCRDCLVAVCKRCQLMNGHSDHRSHAWRPEEIYHCCVQSLEGRCSRRGKQIHDYKIAIKEYIAKVEVILLNELGRSLEQANEPDRLLISRLNRALATSDLRDDRPSLYHLPSPTRPAWKTWNLDQEDPKKMEVILENSKELLHLPRTEIYEKKNDKDEQAKEDQMIELRDRAEWNPRQAAEYIATCLGTRIHNDTQSVMGYSRATTPDRRSLWSSDGDLKRRGVSADGHRRTSNVVPLEPSVFVRDRPSVMSFREKSIPLEEADSPEQSVNGNGMGGMSKPGSAMSSIPPYPMSENGLDSTVSSTQVTPVPINATSEHSNGKNSKEIRSFGDQYLTRPICVQSFSTKTKKDVLAVSDSCGGVYVTTAEGQITEHVLIKNSSASSVSIDEKNSLMYVSVMQAKGRSIHVFDIENQFKKIDVIPCPKDPKIEMSRTRWITVGPRGQLFMTSGDNIKSALWVYMRGRKGWKTLKEARKSRYQYLSVAEDQAEYKAVVLLTCDAANNRLLLFVVDHSQSLINEYDLSKTYRLGEHITSPASAIVDKQGNLLVLDYANGRLWILLSGVKGIRRLKEINFPEPLLPQQALGITVLNDYCMVACFSTREIRIAKYLEDGVFKATTAHHPIANGKPTTPERRANSLPRPPQTVL